MDDGFVKGVRKGRLCRSPTRRRNAHVRPLALDVLGKARNMLRLILDGLCERGQPALVRAYVLQVVCGALERAARPVGSLGRARDSSSSLLAAASFDSPSTLCRGILMLLSPSDHTTPTATSVLRSTSFRSRSRRNQLGGAA
jgi:hypothetical protein